MAKRRHIITLFALALMAFASCSTQKRLQRSIERHGVQESAAFMVEKYPWVYKEFRDTVDTTIVKHDTIVIKEIDTTVNLIDSADLLVHNSDSIRVVVNTVTKKVTIKTPPKYIYKTDTLRLTIPCPPIDCPDLEKIKTGFSFPSWLPLVLCFFFGLYFRKLFRIVLGLVKP